MGLFDTYYFVPASDIERAKLICKINDSGREYQSIGRISANELSCLKDIPLEFQRLVLMSGTLKKNRSRLFDKAFSKQNVYFANEFISNFDFCSVSQQGDTLSLINAPFYSQSSRQWFYNYISCICGKNSASYSEVITFFAELKRNGLFDNYFKFLSELFKLNETAVLTIEQGGSSSFQKCIKKIG